MCIFQTSLTTSTLKAGLLAMNHGGLKIDNSCILESAPAPHCEGESGVPGKPGYLYPVSQRSVNNHV